MNSDRNAFSSFRALEGNADSVERDQLFRNMARLFTYVCDRCDDEQVEQYDMAMCQLAELVEVEGRSEVAQLLAPLERAPGTVVVKLANDEIEVAQPLLEFSNVLSDDDLIEIVSAKSEEHRVVIASRTSVTERVGDAIVSHGGPASLTKLAGNENAELGNETLVRLVEKASADTQIAKNLRGRKDVDWEKLHGTISEVGAKVLKKLALVSKDVAAVSLEPVNEVVFNRLRNRAGFNSMEWRVAWNQVKGLNDRRKLNGASLARFARFGYGHHLGAGMSVMLRIRQDVFVRWLAGQDYVAFTVAAKTLGVSPDLFQRALEILPWRDLPDEQDIKDTSARFDSLERKEAEGIFALWREHTFRKRAGKGTPSLAATGT
ncbi:hypothetical protein MNBD_ALPHA12-2310 [hydrothermal vent metagenome]|uniref:DUF2336 domain-containing protein n=1 Tax=hydrothermal vent metagenome TaxID=652676 RepID=A0A3B0U2Z1_9ZZZZ